jgi:hypothetical protein
VQKLTILITFVFMLSGCCPIPHTEYFAPKVSGVLVNEDVPLSQATVYLSAHAYRDDCEKYDLTATTNEKGEFEIGPVRKFQFFVMVIGDPIVSWDLCVDSTGGRHSILRQGGRGFSRDTLQVRCDISAKTEYIDAFPAYSGKCRLLLHNTSSNKDTL